MNKIFEPIKTELKPKLNNILAALHKAEYERISAHLELVELPLGWKLSKVGDRVKYIHFPVSGIVSLIYDLEDGSSSETAIVGNEGMVGICIFMGGDSMPSSTEVQCAGYAYRLSRKFLQDEFALGGQLQQICLLYTLALIAQTSQTAVCNQHHLLEQKLCRLLLMIIDRVHENKVDITHELLAKLLGVRRSSVTDAAGKLQKDEIITYTRGCITALDRPKLEMRVCECYAVITNKYEHLLPFVKN